MASSVSAFFWIYAPVQLFAGWLCDRFSVYRLMAVGVIVWAASTLLMGFAGGFVSLLVLRVMLGIGESIVLSRQFEDHRPACPARAARHRQCLGARPGSRLARRSGRWPAD